MKGLVPIAALLLAVTALAAQTSFTPVQCSRDSQGNEVCVGGRPDNNTCGYYRNPFGGGPGPVSRMLPCYDMIVRKTRPDGQTVFTRVLGGERDEIPRQFLFDAQDNIALFGTTYSNSFPTTPDAVQHTYSGRQPPVANYVTPLPAGGDLFLSILSPSGDLLYSTFLGSSGNDTILGVRAASNGQVDVLAGVGRSNFPVFPPGTAVPAAGPVLLTFDLTGRRLLRSGYLPIAAPGSAVLYAASLRDDGTVAVTTAGGLYTFGRDGRLLTFVSLESFAFAEVPQVSADPAGDVWLVGLSASRQTVVAKLIAGAAEAFRWTLPIANGNQSCLRPYLLPPFFGPDGLTYLGGLTSIQPGGDHGKLLWTTPNALLTTPCSTSYPGILAVLDAQGEVKLLSYLRVSARSFVADPDGAVTVILSDRNRVLIDLSPRPRAACVTDALDRVLGYPSSFGVGEIVHLRGGGFGPQSPGTVTLGTDQRFPTSLNGLTVEVAGVAAPILSAAPGEVVFAILFETPDGDAIPVVVQDQDQRSAALPIPVRAAAPWLVEPILNADGTPVWYTTRANWGSTVTLFLTGAGPYSPPLDNGQVEPVDTSHRLQLPVSVSFPTTGPTPEPGTILYAGPAPGFIGLAQINIQLPPLRPLSSIVAQLTIGSVSAYLPSIWMQ